MYENKSHKELIELINSRNETIIKLVNDLKKQRKVQSELIQELRNGRAELLKMIQKIETKEAIK